VLSDIQGKDNLDTAARRAGAFHQFWILIGEMSEGRDVRNRLTPDEIRISKSYRDAESRIVGPILNSFNAEETRRLQMQSPRAQWYGQYLHYQIAATFKNELLEHFFSPAWRVNYLAVHARNQQRLAASQQRQPKASALQPHGAVKQGSNRLRILIAIIMAVVGLALTLWVEKRKFHRRNAFGLEEFASFGGMLGLTLMENLVLFVGAVSLLVAIIMVVFLIY